jgi:hypothetical protein
LTTDLAVDVRRELIEAAGGYLRNVIREPDVTCRVCAAPVQGFESCWRCSQDQNIPGLADVVAPLTYAIGSTQSGTLLWRYKDHPVRKVREEHGLVMRWLLSLGMSLHERCIGVAAGRPVSLRLTVPSLTGRPGAHPFTEIARTVEAASSAVNLVPTPTATCARVTAAERFSLDPDISLAGQHVLIIDDTWTTGSNAQSAVLAVRRAGAAAVSVLVVGRWLSPNFGNTARFIRTRLRSDYDPAVCPVTGGECP